MVDRYQYVDLNSFEIKINFVNVAVLEKNHKIETGNHLSAHQQWHEGEYKIGTENYTGPGDW